MSWIALSHPEMERFEPAGIGSTQTSPDQVGIDDDTLLVRGTLLIETRVPNADRPRTLLHFERDGVWPFLLSLKAIPGGGLILIVNQGGSVIHQALNPSVAGRVDVLRLSFCWDAPARRGHLALEQNNNDQVLLVDVPSPCPFRIGDLRALFLDGPHRFVAPEVVYAALSDKVEPVGPMPSLHPDTPIATPQGFRPLRVLRRGDTVISANGETVPVLRRLHRTVPALGTHKPLRIRRPYFGLQQDIIVAPSQRLVLSGSEVEYLFGREAVLAPTANLTGGHAVQPMQYGPLVTYAQLLLPQHETLIAAGSTVESLYIGRMHRKPGLISASVLSGMEKSRLPDHGNPSLPVLRPFDARILAERRVA